MRFTARELRNKENPLLRRIQRQIDNRPCLPPVVEEEDFSKLFKHQKRDKEPVFNEPIRKQTRLSLHKSRGGRK